ncbi:MAG: hypothetical protein A2086_09955 [Spirochaetes bacterium GWD1_27_9]|nr:MAG: hypothetical protein A2Z98_06165 [Spirochaetes bacterium GWB1_27_13]OHD23231.1 MAG: hypothetical protein A2Y34_07355 [Spirochaetes bacterium GWC1_27_15]OHD42055.1 MAG: hypothetical protein A2086_09955 [Spirochaetes bacterium GWD1_27_9]
MEKLNILVKGNDIFLNKLPPDEILDFITHSINLLKTIKEKNNLKDFYIENIKNGSIDFETSSEDSYYNEEFINIQNAVKLNKITQIYKYLPLLLHIKKFVTKHNAKLEIMNKNEKIFEMDRNTNIKYDNKYITARIVEYGILEKIGGAEPTLVIVNKTGKRFQIKIEKEDAIKYSIFLYKEIKALLKIKLDTTSGEYKKIIIIDISPIKTQKLEKINSILENISKHSSLSKITNPVDFITNIRNGNI